MFTPRNSLGCALSQKPNGSSRIPSSSSVGSSEDANCLRYVSSGFPVFTVLSAKSQVNICCSCVRFHHLRKVYLLLRIVIKPQSETCPACRK